VDGLPVLFLGGTEDTVRLKGLQVGSYKAVELDEMNEKTWKVLTT
jgi:hypothetical protein